MSKAGPTLFGTHDIRKGPSNRISISRSGQVHNDGTVVVHDFRPHQARRALCAIPFAFLSFGSLNANPMASVQRLDAGGPGRVWGLQPDGLDRSDGLRRAR